jgi:hypothetical protein
MTSDGRVALEPKANIRRRVGRSPDHGDALALALIKSIKIAFIIFSGLCAAGIFFSLSRGELRSGN